MIEKAIEVAIEYHSEQKRKGTEIPYLTHPISGSDYMYITKAKNAMN